MPFAPIAMIARFAGVSDTIRALMSNKEDTDAALRQDFFYSKLYSIVWSSALSFVDLRGVALKKAWSFSKDDGPHRRLFIISFLADMASGQEPFPMTMQVAIVSNRQTCRRAEQNLDNRSNDFVRQSGECPMRSSQADNAVFLGSCCSAGEFRYSTRLQAAATCHAKTLGPPSRFAKRVQVCRARPSYQSASGFGLRALEDISQGEFVCEFIGIYSSKKKQHPEKPARKPKSRLTPLHARMIHGLPSMAIYLAMLHVLSSSHCHTRARGRISISNSRLCHLRRGFVVPYQGKTPA
jgi:hypothetical protein